MFNYILIGIFAILFIVMLIFSKTSYARVVKIYKKYDNEFVYCGLNGYQFCLFMIQKLGLKTQIMLIDGELKECYVPKQNVVYITNHSAQTSSVSSICICAHELGHAYQNKTKTGLFVFQRILNVLSQILLIFFPFMIIAGIILLFFENLFDIGTALLIGALATPLVAYLLKVFTLPMEMQASKIAYKFLKDNNVLSSDELKHGKKVLNAAIGTYVANLFSPVFGFFRAISRLFGR